MNKIGVQTLLNKAKDIGLTTLNRPASEYGLPLALGAGEAKLTEMTSAYTTFANQGNHPDMQLVMSIQDKNKKEIYKEKPTSTRVFSEGTSYIMSSILSDNAARAEEFGSSLTVSNSRPVAVKTGTTNDYRDAWTIGYTPSLTIGVWIGNNDNSQMSAVAGSSGAAPIWKSLMQQILNGTPVEKFTQPSTVVSHDVCRNNGALAATAGGNTYNEVFLSGTLPTATCNEPAKQETPKQEEKKDDTDNQQKKDTTAPSTPTGVTATPGATKMELSWTASTDDTAVTMYRIYRNGRQIATSTTNSFTDTGLTPLTTYIYTIVALEAAGNASSQSSPASATTLTNSGGGGTTPPTN